MIGFTNGSVIYAPTTRYADLVIGAFHARVSKSKRMSATDFDPKTEYDNFIASYVGRFGVPVPNKKVNKPRKGIGGAQEKELTRAVRKVLDEARDRREELGFEVVLDRTWEELYPSKDKLRFQSKWKIHKRDVRERLSRLAPELLPRNKSKKKPKP